MANETISLKGHQDGYELVLKSEAQLSQIEKELKALLDQLYKDNSKFNADKVDFKIKTGNRLLTAGEKKKIEDIFADYPLFSIHRIKSDVLLKEDATAMIDKNTVHVNADIIRNGQVKTVDGDVLFMGTIHEGGILQATGNIYLLGNVEGIVSAGYPDHNGSVIVGNLEYAQQVRIADLVTIFDDDVRPVDDKPVVYVNDLHKLAFMRMDELKKARPKIFASFGGF